MVNAGEEARALAYQARVATRAAFRAANQILISGSDDDATRVRDAWAPVLERTKASDREPEEDRPVGIANG